MKENVSKEEKKAIDFVKKIQLSDSIEKNIDKPIKVITTETILLDGSRRVEASNGFLYNPNQSKIKQMLELKVKKNRK